MDSLYNFQTGHHDLIHDLSFDYYGNRIATCSSDQYVKVWDKSPVDESHYQWTLSDSWKAHDAAVLKVVWAHPEYGQVMASCSFDRSIRIWEEQPEETKQSGKRWLERARLVDSRGTVQDIKFAPQHLGLKLATVSVDGVLRIYEAMDVINLAHWTLMEDFEVAALSSSKERNTEYCLSWCQSRFLPPMLVIGCGRDNVAKIFHYDEASRKWNSELHLTGHGDTIHSVAWAPSMGRSYQLIATGCKDRFVRIYRLYGNRVETYRVELVSELEGHSGGVWRVEWNLTGTILASSGDDGTKNNVVLWKADILGEYKIISAIGR